MTTTFENADFTTAISSAQAALGRFAEGTESDVNCASQAFRQLAHETDTVLARATSIVEDVNAAALDSVLSELQRHCLQCKSLQEARLNAATTALEKLQTEGDLLKQVWAITHQQENIASHLKALSMLTNIEAICIGGSENEFRLLAKELSDFSAAVLQQTFELTAYIEKRKRTVDETFKAVAIELPYLKAEVRQMEDDLVLALKTIESSLAQLSQIPEQFNRGARDTAQQIAGVITAVQAHDITRQQIEHVQRSLEIILPKVSGDDATNGTSLPIAYAGLRIQAAQLRMIKEIVVAWISQIGRCMVGIQSLSAAELADVPPAILRQLSELTVPLNRLESLQRESQRCGVRIQQNLAGLDDLRGLATRHMEQSQAIRDRLKLLTFNSRIEAKQLGRRGSGVSAIAKLIAGLAADWSGIADGLRGTIEQIAGIYQSMHETTGVFSDANSALTGEDQPQTETRLEQVNGVATFVAKAAEEMQALTARMRTEVAQFDATKNRLTGSLVHLDTAQTQVAAMICRLEECYSETVSQYDPLEVEQLFSGLYTTEAETRVMSAVLRGTTSAVPVQSLEGNSVEMF